MKLTKLQRYTAYCIMLEELQHGCGEIKYNGICWMIGQLFMDGENLNTGGWLDSIRWFPELMARKPKELETCYGSWFVCNDSGRKKRIELLKQCIIETHPQK